MTEQIERLLQTAAEQRANLGETYHDRVMESIYTDAARIADQSVSRDGQQARLSLDQRLDHLLTHRVWGFVTMGLMLMAVFWITIAGANIPSAMLGDLLLGQVYDGLHQLGRGPQFSGLAQWLADRRHLSGDGLGGGGYAAANGDLFPRCSHCWKTSAICRGVAFNLDRLFSRAGAHGKQSLSMMMGFGCNAAGGGFDPDYRQPTGTPDRDYHQ